MDDEYSVRPATSRDRGLLSWWRIGFLSDYLAVVAVFAIAILIDRAGPFLRPIDSLVLNDLDLSHPHLSNIVTNLQLVLLSVVFPCGVVVLVTVLRIVLALRSRNTGGLAASSISPIAASLRDIHHYTLGLLLSVAVTMLVTDFMKYSVNLEACTGDPKLVTDGRKSFPSGHTSLSFAGCTFLSIYLLAILEVMPVVTGSLQFDVVGHLLPGGAMRGVAREYPVTGRSWRFAFALAPLFVSLYIAISRTQQYIHHPTDVLAGAILGIVIAAAVHYSRIPLPPVPVPRGDANDD
ncbi:hypothetical protein HK101_008148 [Irineochytrium annulatum]|nr:hypothetical protein HK101_008148 [Irineochytrium annulatum]